MANKSITIATVVEKNKVASDSAFVVLLELQIANTETGAIWESVYVANNDENVVYQSETYYAFPFEINLRQEAGAIPEITLSAHDYQRVLLGKLSQYSGISGSQVILRIVNTANLLAPPEIEETFEVLKTSASDFGISLTLGAQSQLRQYFPRRIQMRDRCPWRYKSYECGYAGALPSCDLSLQGPNGCATHNNSVNFGGFPALVNRGIRVG